jgi:hypothetical protein
MVASYGHRFLPPYYAEIAHIVNSAAIIEQIYPVRHGGLLGPLEDAQGL